MPAPGKTLLDAGVKGCFIYSIGTKFNFVTGCFFGLMGKDIEDVLKGPEGCGTFFDDEWQSCFKEGNEIVVGISVMT